MAVLVILSTEAIFIAIFAVSSIPLISFVLIIVEIQVCHVNFVCEFYCTRQRVLLNPRCLGFQAQRDPTLLRRKRLLNNRSIDTRNHIWRLNEGERETRPQQDARLAWTRQWCRHKRKHAAQSLILREYFNFDIWASLLENPVVFWVVLLSTSHILLALLLEVFLATLVGLLLNNFHSYLRSDEPKLLGVLLWDRFEQVVHPFESFIELLQTY